MAQGNESLHSIAETLMRPADAPPEQAPAPEPEQDAEEVSPNEGEVEQEEEVIEQPEEADLVEDDDQEDPEEHEEEDGDEDDGAGDYVDINDDDLIEVKVDGKLTQFTIADAKKALSGEGAIDARLKEATETRKAAQAERTQMLDQFKEANDVFLSVVNELEGNILPQASVQKPPASLKQSNPDQYYRQLQEYQMEQQSLSEGKTYLQELVQKQRSEMDSQRKAYAKEQAALLEDRLPILKDPEKGKALVNSMRATAQKYGFSDAEIQGAMDHRYYLMVADLAKYAGARGAVARKANTVSNLEGQQAKRPRKLRSGGGSVAKARARERANQNKAATDKARQSGKVKDVASTLIKPRG